REALRDVGAGGDAARVERAHRELRAGLADRLGGDRADRLAEADVAHQRHVHAVAADAHAGARLAGQRATDGHGLDLGVVGQAGGDGLDVLHVEDLARLLLEVADLEVERQAAAVQAHLEVAAGARASLRRVERDLEELGAAAVLLAHDDLVGDVDELAGQVARVGGPEGRVGAALAGAVRRDEVLEDVEALAEVRADRQLDGLARRAGHQAAHARQLTDLLRVAAGARLRHDVERVERHVLREVLEHRVLDLLGRVVPQADDLVEALALGHEAALGGLLDAGELALRVLEDLLLLLGDRHVLDADRDARGRGELEAVLLQAVEEGGGALDAEALEALDDEVAQGAPLVDGVVADQLGGDVAARGERLAHDAAEHGAAGAGLDELAVDADRDGVLHVDVALLHRHERLVDAAEAVLQATDARLPARDRDRRVEVELALGVGLERGLGAVVAVAGTLLADVQLREHVEAEDDVARGVHVRTAVRRREQVVAGEHLEPGPGLRVDRQRHVDRHLVAVEVGVERLAHERVELDRLALDEDRLERLDAEAVERGRAVEEHDLVGDDLLQGVPDLVLHVAVALELLAGAL